MCARRCCSAAAGERDIRPRAGPPNPNPINFYPSDFEKSVWKIQVRTARLCAPVGARGRGVALSSP